MEFKRPETFEDILNLQKYLDESLNNVRERTLRDIKLSLIAEVIEFNEETYESHKTWKTKPYDKAKELEEFTDIWFFLAQMVNFKLEISENFVEIKNEITKLFNNGTNLKLIYQPNIENLIMSVLYGNDFQILQNLMIISANKGYTKDDILNCYWKKWQKNMVRIGKEWN
nr:MAG TPA: NTP-PPase-like protein [Caudoviricetes sp.]